MKRLLNSGVLICLAFVLQLCTEEETPPLEKIQFTLEISTPDLPGGRSSSLRDVQSALITLENSKAEMIMNKQVVKIYRYGDSHVTEALALYPGNYSIKEFMLVDGNQTVLYATPLKNSNLAHTVNRPLPIDFHVSKNDVTFLNIQVTSTQTKKPEDFGYAAFGLKVALAFQLSAFVADSNKVDLTGAYMEIKKGDDLVYAKNLDPKVNQIIFEGDENETYVLTVEKPKYGTYSKEFTYTELQAELNNKPLNIHFTPALILGADISYYDKVFSINIKSSSSLTVDWGDGSRDNAQGILSHEYENEGAYEITITGDLTKVTELSAADYTAFITQIDLSRVINLTAISFSSMEVPSEIDLTHNTQLRLIDFNDLTTINLLKLPETHEIHFIRLDGVTLDQNNIDAIIENIHFNSIWKPIYGGTFSLRLYPESSEMVGPPSEYSMSLLSELKNGFEWRIEPDID